MVLFIVAFDESVTVVNFGKLVVEGQLSEEAIVLHIVRDLG